MISKSPLPDFKKKFDVVSVFIEHEGKILMLHRADEKPQGNTWAMPAGKVDSGEELVQALAREVHEEIGLSIPEKDFIYSIGYYVRYPEYDFMYHVYHLPISKKPSLLLNPEEHKDHQWITPKEALTLPLIPDEDTCIKDFFNI